VIDDEAFGVDVLLESDNRKIGADGVTSIMRALKENATLLPLDICDGALHALAALHCGYSAPRHISRAVRSAASCVCSVSEFGLPSASGQRALQEVLRALKQNFVLRKLRYSNSHYCSQDRGCGHVPNALRASRGPT
jgi:hypothetical protein